MNNVICTSKSESHTACARRENHNLKLVWTNLEFIDSRLSNSAIDLTIDDHRRCRQAVPALDNARELRLKVKIIKKDQRSLAAGRYPCHIDVRVDPYAPASRATVTIERTTENSLEPDLAEALHYYRTIDDEPTAPLDVQIDLAQTRSFGIRTLWSLAEPFDVGAQPK